MIRNVIPMTFDGTIYLVGLHFSQDTTHTIDDCVKALIYWTRKAIPEALPERDDFSEQMEVRENRRELEQVMDAAIEAVTQEADEQQPVMESPVLEKKRNQERE